MKNIMKRQDGIIFYSIHKPIKDVKIKHMIEMSKDIIKLTIEKKTKNTMKDYFSIYLFNDVIVLSIIQNEWDIKINIYNE